MIHNLDSVKFNLTPSMSLELIRFNELKKELNKLKETYNINKNQDIELKIKKIEKKLTTSRNKFIREFRKNNQDEILKYLKIKDQN